MKTRTDLIKIKKASLELPRLTDKDKNTFLDCLAQVLIDNKKRIQIANCKDIEVANKKKLSQAFIQRLTLDEHGVDMMVGKVKEVQKLKSGLGEIIENKVVEKELILQKVRVPIGVIAVIYEARPEVTIEVASLCIKSGNCVILKGGSDAWQTNMVLFECIKKALEQSQLSSDFVQFITSTNRKYIHSLLKENTFIDLVIARGSYAMVKSVQDHSRIPVLAHSAGGARFYIDKSADISIVKKILINAKITKPSACNSLDTIVIHRALVDTLLPDIREWLQEKNIKIVKNDWETEFLSLKLSIKIVDNIDEAIQFINIYSKKHSEGIIATDAKAIEQFTTSVDAAALFVNCSSRLHDGYVFGLGSEMGIATGRLHARGPVGLKELTIYKWIVYGKDHIRE